jgi:hypothetical protein
LKKQSKVLALGVLLVASALALEGCGGGSAPATTAPTIVPKSATIAAPTVAPTSAPVQPTKAPATATTVPPTATPPPTAPPPTDTPAVSDSTPTVPAQSGYNGQWEGKSSTDGLIQFTIENNQITYININYSYQSGSCSVGGAQADAPKKAAINGKDFTAQITDSDGVLYSIAGTFASNTEASGTVEVKGKGFCGDMDAKATWTAKISSTSSGSGGEATPTETEVAQEATPTAANSNNDPTNVLAMFFLSVDSKNIDDAMTVVSDDVVFDIGSTSGIGKDKLKSYLQDQVNRGVVYVGSNITATDNIVNFSLQATGGTQATYNSSSMIVENGKITILTLK